MSENTDDQLEDSSRRRALKIGAATVVGAAVWAEPTIKGLARRPAYAATASGAPLVFTVNMSLPRNSSDFVTIDGVTLTISRDNSNKYTIATDSGTLLSGSLTIDGIALNFTDEANPYGTGAIGAGSPPAKSVTGTVTCS